MERQGNWQFPNSLALLVLRLVMGWIFIYAGAGKLFGAFGGPGMNGDTGFVHMIESQHLPVLPGVAWAWMAALGEFAGGILVMIGLLTRLAAVPLIITMVVAIATFTGSKGFGSYGYNLILIAVGVALILSGAGLISIDAILFRRGLWARGPQPLANPVPR